MALELTREELVSLRNEARRRFQVMIDYIKGQVGDGQELSNDLVRVVISENGCYYEFVDMPEEFSGAVGSGFNHEFLGTQEGIELAQKLYEVTLRANDSNTRELSVMMIYQWEGGFNREDSFVYHLGDGPQEEAPLFEMGRFRPGALPLFFKLKGDSELLLPILGTRKGVLFFVGNLTDQHLLVRIPHQGPSFTDLSQPLASAHIH